MVSYIFLASFILSLILTPFVRWLAIKFNILDRPETNKRKIHSKAIPLMGGVAIFLSFFIVLSSIKITPNNMHYPFITAIPFQHS